ncbi:MAG: hypothetical protein LBV55_02125, partial [Acholeplasmatales bacterium]|nr:hypothetical protein [Acholeplasmatales bacterium]
MKKNRTNTTITKEFKIPSIADNEQLNSILYRGIKASPSRLFSWSGSKIPAVLTTYDHEFSIYQFKNPTTSLKRPTQESPFIATITGTKVLDIAASTVQMQKDTEYVKQTDIYRDQDSQVLGVEKLKKQGLDPFYDTTIINDEKIEKQWGSDYLKKKDIPRPVNDDYPTPEVEEPEVDYTRPTFEATYADEDPIPVSNPLPPLKKPVAVHDSLPTHEFFRIRAKENFDDSWIKERVEALDELFRQFNINANVIDYKKGPSVSLYEIQTQPNVKLNVFETMDKNIQRSEER